MKYVTHFLVSGALSLGLSPVHAERGVLNADGILIVKGADVSSARITIVPENAPAYTLVAGTKRFVLRLPIDDTYLVSFVREGCPTKEMYFDTRVPVEFNAKQFDFPFQVTLEHVDADRLFSYEGPVGFVRYQHPITDFGYETHYVVKVEEEMHERMRQMGSTGTDLKVIQAPAVAMVVDVSRDGSERTVKAATTMEEEEDGVLASTVSEVPRLVHTLAGPKAPEVEVVAVHEEPMETKTALVAEPVASVPAAEPPVVILKEEPVATAVITSEVPVQRPMAIAVPVAKEEPRTDNASPALPTTDVVNGIERHREEEVVVEKRMVIRVVRFIGQNGAVVDEVRKVTHAFGGVYYFHNAQSITERAFLELTAQK